MPTDKEIAQVEQAVKKTGRGGKYNFPSAVEPEDPDIVRDTLRECMHWYKRGEDRANTPEAIRERSAEFFNHCIEVGERPTVEKYCMALGYARQTVNEWEHASDTRADIIKKAKEFIASYDASMAVSGKLNPVLYFFRAKNYYGMKDQTDITIEPRQQMTDISAEEVAAKYAELPGD